MMNRFLLKRNISQFLLLVATITLLFFFDVLSQQPQLIWLGTLGGDDSEARAVSDNGSVVVGVSQDANGNPRAFRWTIQTGIQDLGTLGGNGSVAADVSADGSIIVGWSDDANNIYRAFKWTESTGMQDLGAGDYSTAHGISADGTAIIVDIYPNAYRWTQAGGLQDLGTLGGSSSGANDISADGSMICGYSYVSAGDPYAFRWVDTLGMEQIGTFYSFALGISGDGNTITGFETGSAGLYKAFRWTQSGGFEFDIAGNFSQGNAVSEDGSIIVGSFGNGAFRLSNVGGLEELNQTYSSLLTSGSELSNALGISLDGQFIVGEGTNGITSQNEGFLLAVNGINSVDELSDYPSGFHLNQNYPNPFNPSTTISFLVPNEEFVSLKVYNSLGEEVAELVNETKPAGNYSVTFDASELTSGIYFYKLSAGDFTQTKKMIYLK
ncbi:MAG: T9SS C-terminal target domain-containing protein [Ignavibacteriae bacterium]|jgi:probable HAF family extracellular repeat protein|nr:MAG: T9SS C-terminal target domain-containing protein [Chlorobiota bacterium]MBL1121711.1 T9SS C-terminal target domain-containing protein [Ignavibacteriota bacterium]